MANNGHSEVVNDAFVFEFESKFVELIEELRLKRQLEHDNEETIKSLLNVKYELERLIEDDRRKHKQEKEKLEQKLACFKKDRGDKQCQLDFEKTNNQKIENMYQSEIRLLREDLKNFHSEKLNFEKQTKELESKLTLQNNLQDNIVWQFNELRREVGDTVSRQKELVEMQTKLKEDVAIATNLLENYNLNNKNLSFAMQMMEKRNLALKSSLISANSHLKMLEQNITPPVQKELPQRKTMSRPAVEERFKKLLQRHQQSVENLVSVTKLLNEAIERKEPLEKRDIEFTTHLQTCSTDSEALQAKLKQAEASILNLEQERAKLACLATEKDLVKEFRDAEIQVSYIDFWKANTNSTEKQKKFNLSGIEKGLKQEQIEPNEEISSQHSGGSQPSLEEHIPTEDANIEPIGDERLNDKDNNTY